MAGFIISTDSSSDMSRDFLTENNIYCIVMKRIQDGNEIGELYNSEDDFDNFYAQIKNGALPTTTQLNSYELETYFDDILQREKEGDIIHIALSSGLSGTCDNARATADQLNKRLCGRKIYVLDSLTATGGITMLVHEAIRLRDSGENSENCLHRLKIMRDSQQSWCIASDLFHLRRGGRLSGFKAAIGTILGIKPIIIVAKNGKLALEHSVKGSKKAIKYILEKMEKGGIKKDSVVYLVRTSKSDLFNELKSAIMTKFPSVKPKESIVGPIVGTHLGCGCAIVIFEGNKRLEI